MLHFITQSFNSTNSTYICVFDKKLSYHFYPCHLIQVNHTDIVRDKMTHGYMYCPRITFNSKVAQFIIIVKTNSCSVHVHLLIYPKYSGSINICLKFCCKQKKLPEIFHSRIIQLGYELSSFTCCQTMRQRLVHENSVNSTILPFL